MQSTSGIVAPVGDNEGKGDATSRGARVVRQGPLEIDMDRLVVRVRGRRVAVNGLQLKLLLLLARYPDWVFTRAQLLSSVWGVEASYRDPKVVDVLICRLRKKLAMPDLLESVRSFGYRLRPLSDDAEVGGSPGKERRARGDPAC